ncbi:MAG: GNAT family N-acetyltransferase [Halobacteriovoraceae bacterium]|jgi:GNAT superfamily N-acetyltransferase|nr:GNAT family N-acetyltransferase [Halobacteriovoraceae bacterium]
MKNITIRAATIEDAAEIANVHINSWREAYKGLLPQDFLDKRPLYFKNRYELWKRVTADENQVTFVAQSNDNGVVGFINGTNARDADFKDYCEVWSFYLLQDYHKQGIGYNLLYTYFLEHKVKGYSKAYLWVLDKNPTIKFYERTGAKLGEQVKHVDIAGIKSKELCYVWDSHNFEKIILAL